ncbi:hypothetical protein NDA11_000889 [Ustilago hordei]|uniref:Uncharacterized protein n=1 Tax=Ustilago hordei TaxID=120017 RepID=I2FV13_USTHO|nr:uncharacterized protein UHO2_06550 [Ustilago hordei]KAJ1040669.1 hypothetical protein NDA10_004519 [Ustilago hordei]KAJ1571621.1 hypothetical protein NDA11_000889 [Ustilago hordei]KAJ1576441.1 hypothetical protein NDA12_004855 [Ustilago hordei]KAJ1577708.1 hypothetical protein NDA15_000928 [Ustilago hordei]KAJ1598992.1 hypothetical protein NDA14_007159 [Ustilago hordei]
MPIQPTLAPRAEALWERQQDPVASFLSSLFGSPDNTDSVVTNQPTPTTTRAFTTTSSSSRSTRTTTSSSLPPPVASTPTTTSTSLTSTTSSTSSTPTSTSTSSSSTFIITTSSPSTLISTSQVVSGTSTSQVVLTTVVTPVVTTTAAAARSNSSSSGSNGGLIGGLVGGVIGGLALIALIITICVMASRRKSRTGHAYFLCFGERPSRNAAGDLRHSGGAWPTFDPQDDHRNSSYAAGAAGVGAGAAAASPSRRTRREQTNATLPAEFANEQDPERYGYSGSAAAHNGYPAAATQYDAGYDAYDAYGTSGYPDMQQRPARNGAGALAAGAAAGGAGAYLYNNSSPAINRRSSAGHPSHDSTSYANMSPHATALNETAPAPWTLPMMGWQDTHGPYSVAGVGGNMVTTSPPQAQFMVSPSEANRTAAAAAAAGAGAGGVAGAAAGTPTRSTGPDYSHFDPPEIRDARAREAAAEALARGSFSTAHSYGKPTWPRRQPRRLSSSQGTPINQHSNLAAGGAMAPPAYVDAQDGIMEEMDDQPRRLHLTNAEPDVTTDDDSSRGGPTRRPTHNHKDQPPAATYRQH